MSDERTTIVGWSNPEGFSDRMFCFQGTNLAAVYANVYYVGNACVWNNRDVTLHLRGDITASHVYGTIFHSVLYASPDPFSISVYADGTLIPPATAREYYRWDIEHWGGGRDLWEPFPYVEEGVYIGKLDEFHWAPGDDTTGYAYIGGSSYGDTVTDDLTTYAVQIPLPGLKVYLDYFPGVIWGSESDPDNTTWENSRSCNRSGGYFQRMNNGSWLNRKNREGDLINSSVYIYQNGSDLTVAPQLGKI